MGGGGGADAFLPPLLPAAPLPAPLAPRRPLGLAETGAPPCRRTYAAGTVRRQQKSHFNTLFMLRKYDRAQTQRAVISTDVRHGIAQVDIEHGTRSCTAHDTALSFRLNSRFTNECLTFC